VSPCKRSATLHHAANRGSPAFFARTASYPGHVRFARLESIRALKIPELASRFTVPPRVSRSLPAFLAYLPLALLFPFFQLVVIKRIFLIQQNSGLRDSPS
jgi:hypothetical protein